MASTTRALARSKTASAVLGAALLGSVLSVVATAGPAAAASQYSSAQRTTQAYTDSQAPKQSFENQPGDLPLGSWVNTDGATHQSRIYATYDLSAFTGTHLLSATLDFAEAKVTQCQATGIEVWQTDGTNRPITWQHAPHGETLLGTISAGGSVICPAYFLQLDLTSAIRKALAEHRSTFSVELRLSAADEGNTSLGRWLKGAYGVTLGIRYNTPPQTPVELFNAYQKCATSHPYPYLGEAHPQLEAIFTDADSGDFNLTGDFAVWPVDNPSARTEYSISVGNGGEGGTDVPTALTDGVTYAWQARADDGTDKSAWSKPCYFRVDTTAPSAEPKVVSANYPENASTPGGQVPSFTFGANGVSDVVGYQFSWQQDMGVFGCSIGDEGIPQCPNVFDRPDVVRADKLGGSAILTQMPPLSAGPVRLWVRSIDRALNESNEYMYQFFVGPTYPTVTLNPQTPQPGVPTTLTFAPNPALAGIGVDSYTYEIDHTTPGTPQTVTAGADGTASVTVSLSNGPNWIRVTSHSPNGWVSEPNQVYEYVDTSPTVTSDVYPDVSLDPNATGGGVGVPGVFKFVSKVPGIQSFSYSIDYGPDVTIPADANGTAQITYTPDTSGYHEIDVYATAADGTVFDTYYYGFVVN